MAARKEVKDLLVKLIVGAGQATPSPPVGPVLGSKGVKSMDFCKEFNALTNHIITGTPIPCLITVRPDRSFHFIIRTPTTSTLLFAAAGVPRTKHGRILGANAPGRAFREDVAVPADGKSQARSAGGGVGMGVAIPVAKGAGGTKKVGSGGGSTQVGEVSLKHVYEIAKIKATDPKMVGLSLEGIVKSVVAQARSCGIGVVP